MSEIVVEIPFMDLAHFIRFIYFFLFFFYADHTVSHHDPELTFNHSFIEPPSSGWVTEGSSFDSDEEEGEALYCVPPREGKRKNTSHQTLHCPLLAVSRTASAKLAF